MGRIETMKLFYLDDFVTCAILGSRMQQILRKLHRAEHFSTVPHIRRKEVRQMFIKQADLFQGVSTKAKGIIDRQKTKQSYREGDLVFHEGEEAEYFYTLERAR